MSLSGNVSANPMTGPFVVGTIMSVVLCRVLVGEGRRGGGGGGQEEEVEPVRKVFHFFKFDDLSFDRVKTG